jgi:hypothetical protein
MKAILTILGIIALCAAFIYLMERHSEAQDAAYQAYDNCVLSHYGMSAASYYQEHGETPECN